uniref:Uncharacterized protein n=1 Tax=Picea glauca TaxID=3330 RepID=A0A101M5P8_PICGL|nr:hypothetical protein ABT39_MTgene1186 [Picea glauca]
MHLHAKQIALPSGPIQTVAHPSNSTSKRNKRLPIPIPCPCPRPGPGSFPTVACPQPTPPNPPLFLHTQSNYIRTLFTSIANLVYRHRHTGWSVSLQISH